MYVSSTSTGWLPMRLDQKPPPSVMLTGLYAGLASLYAYATSSAVNSPKSPCPAPCHGMPCLIVTST